MTVAPQMLAWINAVGWTLLHFVWQGAALAVVYRALRPLCRSVAARYRLGMGFLVALLACPVATLFWFAPAPASAGAAALALPQIVVGGDAAAVFAGVRVEALLPWLVGAWFIGASIIAARAFAHWRRLTWLVRHAAIPLPDCRDALVRLCRRFGVSRPVRLLGSMAIDTPMLIGWLRPVILLPISMLSGFTPQQIELIIAHELGHVRRWDYLANLVQVVIETVLFYHPVVHWISRDVRDARESCCDDLVLALADGSPVVYASALAELEQLRHDGIVGAPALAASGGVLLERIRRIVGVQSVLYDPLPRSGGWPIALLLTAAVVAAMRLHTPAADVTAALLQAPAQSVAAISGNPQLAAPAASSQPTPIAPAQPRSAAPAQPTPVHQSSDATPQPTAERIEPVAPVARPHITVAAVAPALPRAGDIREQVSSVALLSAAVGADAGRAASVMPVALQRVQPEYPVHEKIRGVSGHVELQFGIDADGSVRDVTVLSSTADHAFDRVSINALQQWHFVAPADPSQRYTQSFAFALGNHGTATEPCREVIGSHICRHMAAEEEIQQP